MNPKRLLLPLIFGGSLMLSGCMALPVVASYAAVVGMSTSLANDKAERCEAISLKAEKDGLSRRAEERILRKENCIDK